MSPSLPRTQAPKPFETVAVSYGEQRLWPDHCVQGRPGAALRRELAVDRAILIVRKGYRADIDSYSAFMEADGKTPTGLAGFLKEKGVRRVFACGVATDYCVAYSALDARLKGFETFVIDDACRAIDADDLLKLAWARMETAGIVRIQSEAIAV